MSLSELAPVGQTHAPQYRLRFATGGAALARAQALRARVFLDRDDGRDADAFDARCVHVLVEEGEGGALVACARALCLPDGRAAARESYSAQVYGLECLARHGGAMVEIGRFCADPRHRDPDVLRLIWAGITALAERHGAGLLFGCASFAGTDPAPYRPAFAHLAARHLATGALAPARRAPEVFAYAEALRGTPPPDPRTALLALPPLLRGYLTLGSRVSDHAVIDRQMNTLHVLTLLDVDDIAPARARLLRAAARGAADVLAADCP